MEYQNIKASQLIEGFKQMLAEKWGYIYGARGTLWTQAHQAKATRQQTKLYGQRWVGHIVIDCSGSFWYWYNKAGSYMYQGSNTMWRKYTVKKGKVKEMNMIPGMAVFKRRAWQESERGNGYYGDSIGDFYHVGLYIGNGKVIEAKGTAYGVVESSLSEWGYAATLKYTDYDIGIEAEDEPEKEYGEVFGGALNMRQKPTKNSQRICQIPNGKRIEILEKLEDWNKVLYNNHTGYAMSKYIRQE